MSQQTISLTVDGTVAEITINRPERRNALNHDAVVRLRELVEGLPDSVRVLILTGADGHFCAGADLKELEDLAFTRTLRGTLDALAELPVPTIAAISGSCMGLGTQLALACDLRLASPDARFAVPVAKLGLMVDHWTLQRLALLAGQSAARWLTLTARVMTASQAHNLGFVNELTADEGADVRVAARALAAEISALAPLALSGTKLGLNQLEHLDLDEDGSYRAAFERAWGSQDLQEGQQAFAERRKPAFRGV
ncbi:MAG: enoyl-CoA hydratase/isomerase family protein [Actinobacteria bacterium]|nr:enoyl-CoA hydratase/isomerase family protein [Actinomycetota bacterium]